MLKGLGEVKGKSQIFESKPGVFSNTLQGNGTELYRIMPSPRVVVESGRCS
jgi:hypothetical protein